MSKFLRREFLKEYVPKIQQAVFQQLLATTQEEMRKEAKNAAKEIYKSIKCLLALIMAPEEIDKIVEGAIFSLLSLPP